MPQTQVLVEQEGQRPGNRLRQGGERRPAFLRDSLHEVASEQLQFRFDRARHDRVGHIAHHWRVALGYDGERADGRLYLAAVFRISLV